MTLVVSRARAHPSPLVAVVVNVLIVCTLVAGVGATLPLVQKESLATGLAEVPPDDAVVEVVSTYDDENPELQDRVVTRELTPVTSVAGGGVVRRLDSGSYDLLVPGRPTWGFAAVSGADDQIRFEAGRAPSPTDAEPVEVAVPARSDLAVGDQLRLRNRADERRIDAVVVGTWTVSAAGERWVGTLEGDLMLVDPMSFGAVAGAGSSARWRAVPALSQLEADQLGELSAAVAEATGRGVERATEDLSGSVRADTGLVTALGERARELVVLRALLLVPVALLLLLGGACLFLVAAALADARRAEESLLRSRGAGHRQLVAPTVWESGVLCLLSAVLAPPLAWLLIRIGDVRPPLTTTAWLASGVAAAICATALVLPVVLRALTGDRGEQLSAERQRRRALTLLVAAVLLVTLLGGLAVLELRGFGATVTGASTSSAMVDPLLVSSPALLLLALAVLVALLVLPLLFGLVARTLGTRGVSFALGSRFAARAPNRTVPLALVVILASGTLSFAAIQRLSSADAREARADYEVGADVLVTPPADAVRAGAIAERAALRGVPGVRSVAVVHRGGTFVEDLAADAIATALDAGVAADLLGPSAASGSWQDLVVRPWRDQEIGVPLPEEAERVTVDIADVDLGRVTFAFADADGVPRVVGALGRGGRVAVDFPGGAGPGLRLVAVGTGSENPLTSDERPSQLPATVRADGELLARNGRWWAPAGNDFVAFGEVPPDPGSVPVLLTDDLAASTSLRPGDTVEFQALGAPLVLDVVATAPYLRTVGSGYGGVLLDSGSALPALLAAGFDADPSEWWLTTADGRADAVAAELQELPHVADGVVTRSAVVARLDADPSTGGAALSHLLALTAAGCLVVGALLLLSVVLLRRRERAAHDRTLVTLGAKRRDLVGVLGNEYALTTGVATAAGVALGAVVAQVTLVSMTLGPDGELLVPAPELHLPWLALLPLIAMLALPLLAMVLLTRYDGTRALATPDRISR